MKVLVYSEKLNKENKTEWHRSGREIKYYKNNITRNTKSSFYTLTFTYDFSYECDTVKFAYCYPYTYSELQNDLNF